MDEECIEVGISAGRDNRPFCISEFILIGVYKCYSF